MAKWTVIGLYESTGQVYSESFDAEDAYTAMIAAARVCGTPGGPADLQIMGAVAGEHQVIAACEESGTLAYATDLQPDDIDTNEPGDLSPEDERLAEGLAH